MAQKWLPASSLTGGGEGALDAIDGSNVSDGDRAIVIADKAYFYVLDADSAAAESSPDVIQPDSNAGDKRWILKETHGLIEITTGSFLLAGTDNQSSGTVTNSFIVGGDGNLLSMVVSESLILGGSGNEIKRYVSACSIVAGINNKILVYPENCAVLGGNGNIVAGSCEDVIVSGGDNYVKGAVGCGVSGNQHVIMALSDAKGIFVSGVGASARLPGQKSHANGFFDVAGDAQISKFVLRSETTDGTETNLPMSNDFAVIPLQAELSWKYVIDIVARQVGGTTGITGDSAFWRITGGIKNVGAALAQGTVSFAGNVAEDDTVTIGSTTYTFKDAPGAITDLQSGTASVAAVSFAEIVKAHHPYIFEAEISGADVILTIHPEMGGGSSSVVLTTSGVNLSADGGGTFGGTTAWAEGVISMVGTPQGTGTPDSNDHDDAIAAQGTITMSGIAVADETFVIDTQTFIWKAARSTTGEVTIGASATEAAANIVTAVNTDLSSVVAEQVSPGTAVEITAASAGSPGNSIVFTESSTNMSIDGSGTLGGTTQGGNAASLWEADVEADDFDMGLKINVTGEANKTIRWVAKIQLIEVG